MLNVIFLQMFMNRHFIAEAGMKILKKFLSHFPSKLYLSPDIKSLVNSIMLGICVTIMSLGFFTTVLWVEGTFSIIVFFGLFLHWGDIHLLALTRIESLFNRETLFSSPFIALLLIVIWKASNNVIQL